MIEKIKNSSTTRWILTTLSLIYTIPLTLFSFYEYFCVGVFKMHDGYPFGQEGPVAEIDFYKSADLYARHMLTMGILGLVVTALLFYFAIKRKTIPVLIIFTGLVCFIIYGLATNNFQID